MAKGRDGKGPQFVRYFGPVVEALKALGGSGRPTEVKDWIAGELRISQEQRDETNESGNSRFGNHVDWAKFYLSAAGYIDSSTRGVWSLTDKGRSYSLSHLEAIELFKLTHKKFTAERDVRKEAKVQRPEAESEKEEPTEVEEDHRSTLLKVLRDLPPSGFESLCQALLREGGFESVTVTGRTGDEGIDGIGILQMNALVSFKVVFQCKRYSGSIGSQKVRDFRGAMAGRADKGIILTTGTFTAEARKESVRDGVPPIELVDSEKILDMCEELEFGLRPRKTYDVDLEFFAKFSKGAS